MPPGVNLKIVPPLPESTSKRLPEPSKASPDGEFKPEAKVSLVPEGVNLKIVPLKPSATKRLPKLSKARPSRGEESGGEDARSSSGSEFEDGAAYKVRLVKIARRGAGAHGNQRCCERSGAQKQMEESCLFHLMNGAG